MLEAAAYQARPPLPKSDLGVAYTCLSFLRPIGGEPWEDNSTPTAIHRTLSKTSSIDPLGPQSLFGPCWANYARVPHPDLPDLLRWCMSRHLPIISRPTRQPVLADSWQADVLARLDLRAGSIPSPAGCLSTPEMLSQSRHVLTCTLSRCQNGECSTPFAPRKI